MFDYNELKEAYGNHFQDLFTKLMKEKYGDAYHSTCPQGNIGDMSVDGILSFDTAFAVYAPEVYNDSKTISKLTADFNGFMAQRDNGNWQTIKRYIFVVKKERIGISPTVFNLIAGFNTRFSVNIWDLDNLKMIINGMLPFSSEGMMFQNFKAQITPLLQYIVDIDFSASYFRITLFDEIIHICKQWDMVQNRFEHKQAEISRQTILNLLGEFLSYLLPLDFNAPPNFNGTILILDHYSENSRKHLDELRLQTYRIRCELNRALEDLYKVKFS